MTTSAMAGAELFKGNEDDFSNAIKEMTIKDLMETISCLQKEMAKEQENFNSLSSELQNFKERNSRQYKQISKDMMASQQRLTLLMNRSMKCFAQQNLHNSSDSPFKRRNSVKGPNPVVIPASASTNLQRSKSLLAVNHTADTDLTSSYQPPLQQHQAESRTTFQHNMNVSHMPVIMKTTANGGIRQSKAAASTNNVSDRNRLQAKPKDAVVWDKENESPAVSSSTESNIVSGNVNSRDAYTDGGVLSNNASVTGGVSGGLYVKRKPAQQQRVVTTANISSSAILPVSQLPLSPVSEPIAFTPFTISATSAASSTYTPSPRPNVVTPISAFSNESQFIKPKHLSSQSEYVSPLQMAQARKGVSKSQNLTLEADSSSRGYAGLPSVKLLAQSFGSNTALNKIEGPSSTYSSGQTNTLNSSRGMYRSNSSLNLSNPQSSTSTSYTLTLRGPTGGAAGRTPQQEPGMFINGKSQQVPTKQLNRVTQSLTASNLNSEPNELEKTRTRLRAVGREISPESASGSTRSAGVAPIASKPATVLTTKNQEEGYRDERAAAENSRLGTYLKRKDIAPGKLPSTDQPASSPLVTIKSINSPPSFISSTMANTAPTTATQNKTSSQIASGVLSSQNSNSDNLKPVQKYLTETPKNSAPISLQTAHQSSNFSQRPQYQAAYSSSNKNKRNNSTSSPPRKESDPPSDPVISRAAVTISRSKSREQLQQIENDTRTNKDNVLKQIQARRREPETDDDESNIRAMSSLSHSMPSLLQEEKKKKQKKKKLVT